YGYVPDKSVAIVFLVLFGISTTLHVVQATYYRMWWFFPTACLCGIGELIGWSGRLWSAISPAVNPYLMQISATILAPTPLLAVNFIILSRLIHRLGVAYSWLSPIWYTIIFLSCDFIALAVQGVGGGMASNAIYNLPAANRGAHIMLGGIVFQFVVIMGYSSLAADFFRRYLQDLPAQSVSTPRGVLTTRLKIMFGALIFSTALLFIRSIYRIIELSTGWTGRIITTQVYFNVLDGAMILLAMFTVNFAHPGLLLRPAHTEPTPVKGVQYYDMQSVEGSEARIL
ncbi:RTA1-like protein, partial [Mycena sp. CBHHK59/15]